MTCLACYSVKRVNNKQEWYNKTKKYVYILLYDLIAFAAVVMGTILDSDI